MMVRNGFRCTGAIAVLTCFIAFNGFAQKPSLSLADFRNDVLMRNLEVEAARLGWEVADRIFRAERGAVFEPELVLDGEYQHHERENTAEEFIARGVDDFKERNLIYATAFEQPLILGGRLSVGYTLRRLENNLREQRELEGPERDYDAFLGVTLIQPLLKNAGWGPVLAMMRLAKEDSEAAFHEWRGQLMRSLSDAEMAYWDLYLVQKRVEFRADSVSVAERVLGDMRERAAAGRTTELEVRQAEAGVSARLAQYLEIVQQRMEASTRLQTFRAHMVTGEEELIQVSDVPVLRPVVLDSQAAQQAFFSLHPDYLIQFHRLRQHNIRRSYAANQRWPQLDLKATYGHNGLGETSSGAFDRVEEGDFPVWSVGVQMRIPLGGGFRARNEHAAARARLRQGVLALDSVAVQIHNEIEGSKRRVANHFEQVRRYHGVVQMRQELLNTEMERLDAGHSDTRKVLEAEEVLTEAREAHVLSMARHAAAWIEMEMAMGTLLQNRGADPMDSPVYKSKYGAL